MKVNSGKGVMTWGKARQCFSRDTNPKNEAELKTQFIPLSISLSNLHLHKGRN